MSVDPTVPPYQTVACIFSSLTGVGIGFHLIWIIIVIVLVVTGAVVVGQAKKAGLFDPSSYDTSDWTVNTDSDSGW